MVWVKVTDRHPREASRAGLSPAARCLHMDALCWIMANDNETRVITRRDLFRLSEYDDPDLIVPELVECRWWAQTGDDTWEVVHDVADQRTNEQILADREKNAGRQARSRERARDARNGVTNAVSNGSPVQTSPVLTPNGVSKNPLAANAAASENGELPGMPPAAGERPDVDKLCTALAEAMVANECKRPNITATWRREARLLLDTGGPDGKPVPLDKALALVDWCQHHHWWRARVQSMKKFRADYDSMRLQALADWERQRAGNSGGTRPPGRSTTDTRVADAQALKERRRARQGIQGPAGGDAPPDSPPATISGEVLSA